jgi:His/Glu/Gln/Arg/opine family amino acid ABC transporter permease subunit
MNVFSSLWDRIVFNLVDKGRYMYLLNGLKITLIITFFAVLLGITIGTLTAIIKVAAQDNKKIRPLEVIADLYTTIIRGTPVMVQLLIVYFVIFASVDVSKVVIAIIAFGLNSGAYVTEIIRAGILAVDKGQTEAGRSLGLTTRQTYRYIVLPQAIKNILPALGNEFISLLKETAVVGYIGLQDLTMGGDIIRSRTYDAFVPLITVALIYLLIVIGLSAALKKFERRLRRSDNS